MGENEIRAVFDEKTITVYQAYCKEIALPAVENQKFVPPANSGDTHPTIPVIGTHFLCYDSLIPLPKLPFFS